MAQKLPVKYLSNDDIRSAADSFLTRYFPARTIPIPIEDIIDVHFEIDIVPMPGLRAAHDVEAFITCDMLTIYVDEYVYTSRPARYRFSLAHEIAHAVMHQKVFRELGFTDIAGWVRSQEAFSEDDHTWLEWQAYAFAGLILVPPDALRTHFDKAAALLAERGASIAGASDAGRRTISGHLAEQFKVSTPVIEKRMDKDSLWG